MTIELVVRKDGQEALYAAAKSKKGSDDTLTVQIKGFGGKLGTIGEVEFNEDEGAAGVVKGIIGLLEDKQNL